MNTDPKCLQSTPIEPTTRPDAAVFAVAMMVGSALLFAVQPMVARMALPVLGGTPAVWNTCMVFFQGAVLGGYALAHLLATRCCPRTQVGVFLVLIVLGGAGLPIDVAEAQGEPPAAPLAWLLGRLGREVGLPALALATASPLLQRWFARVRPTGGEPYFLYAASNLGSLGSLLAYPVLLEPALALGVQSRFWSTAYWCWALLIVATATLLFRRLRRSAACAASSETIATPDAVEPAASPGTRRWLLWAALGAIPASLLQGCTLFLTTDVASIPLLWVVPLALYLVTFVLAFSRHGRPWIALANRLLPFLAAGLLFAILSRSTEPVAVLIGLHLAFLFSAGMVCHGRLVELRPAPRHLTSFYLALSVGGVAGGAFNALLAPRLFNFVAEYPLAIALATATLIRRARPVADAKRRVELLRDGATALALGLGLLAFGLTAPWLVGPTSRLRDAVVFGAAAVACCTLLDRPRRLSLGLAAAFAAGLWLQNLWAGTRQSERNFFGITRVARSGGGEYHQLVHGNTIHGRQFRDPARHGEPLTYYHREGPLGSIFDCLPGRAEGGDTGAAGNPAPTPAPAPAPSAPPASAPGTAPRRIGVIGLGIGSMAAYARPDEAWTFFEVDPAVIRVAQDTNWFTFLANTRAGRWQIVPGDARLRLAREPDHSFDLLLLDAFSSDAIPVHLLTREAVALYFAKLRPGGWLAVHISNRYLDLEPVVSGLAADAGLACRGCDDTDDVKWPGKEASQWMLLARRREDLGGVNKLSQWVRPADPGRVPVWTDQRSAILPVFQWR